MIKNIKLWIGIAVSTMIASIVVVAIFPPVLGIDFTGGSTLEVTSDKNDLNAIQQTAGEVTGASTSTQVSQNNSIQIRTKALTPDQHTQLVNKLKEKGLIKEELRFESIGPTIGAELRSKAGIAVSLAVLGMIAYLAYEFRQASGLVKSWKFGIAAVLALGHDLLFVTAAFGILGHLFGAPIDVLFITAMLTIMGYSVNDTIVIFNRMRNEWFTSRRESLLDLLDRATRLTVIRSLNTSFATILSLIALLLMGGTTIRWFVVALLIGIVVGTYSSIFVAPPLLYLMAKPRAVKSKQKNNKLAFQYAFSGKTSR